MAGVQSWPSVGLAAPVRERNVNVTVDVEHLSFRRFMSDIEN